MQSNAMQANINENISAEQIILIGEWWPIYPLSVHSVHCAYGVRSSSLTHNLRTIYGRRIGFDSYL